MSKASVTGCEAQAEPAIGLGRRALITGLIGFFAAPAIVRYASLMPVRAWARPAFLTDEGAWFLADFDGPLNYPPPPRIMRMLNGLLVHDYPDSVRFAS
jgi:hypothetical protein